MADNIKQMAKEYKELINNSKDGTEYYNQIINLQESQLDMLNALSFCLIQMPQQKKIINYCINCIYKSLDILAKLDNLETYTPEFRNPYMPNTNRLMSNLINTQIDIFVLIDKVKSADTAALKAIENTKLGLISLLK